MQFHFNAIHFNFEMKNVSRLLAWFIGRSTEESILSANVMNYAKQTFRCPSGRCLLPFMFSSSAIVVQQTCSLNYLESTHICFNLFIITAFVRISVCRTAIKSILVPTDAWSPPHPLSAHPRTVCLL